jgi:hypothetical protein
MDTDENIKQVHEKGFVGLSRLSSKVDSLYEANLEKAFSMPLRILDAENGSLPGAPSAANTLSAPFSPDKDKKGTSGLLNYLCIFLMFMALLWMMDPANLTPNPPAAQRPSVASPSPSNPSSNPSAAYNRSPGTRQDWFVTRVFQDMAKSPHRFIDRKQSEKLLETGTQCLRSDDMDGLRQAVTQLWRIQKGEARGDMSDMANIIKR